MGFLTDKFVGLDSYGTPVTVNYRGDDTYKTRTGALLSIITGSLLLIFGIEKAIQLTMRNNPQITITTEVIDYANDETPFDLHKEDFSVVAETQIETENGMIYDMPEDIGRLVVFQLNQHSSVKGDDREAYRQDNYEIDPKLIIPWSKCDAGSHLQPVPEKYQKEIESELAKSKCLDLHGSDISG